MGQDVTKHIFSTLSINFMGVKPTKKQELLEFYYNNELSFKGSEEERYHYFDEVIMQKENAIETFGKYKIHWPPSYETMVEIKFFQNLTDEQAAGLLEAFKI